MSGSVQVDLSKLRTFVKGLDDKHVVKVGIFGSHNSREKDAARGSGASLTNAQIGAKHEFGSFTEGIPMRSFLRMPLSLKSDQILKEASVGLLPLLAAGKMVPILKRLGFICENVIQQAFSSGGFGQWKANAPFTVQKKGPAAILIDTSQLRRSIASKVDTV